MGLHRPDAPRPASARHPGKHGHQLERYRGHFVNWYDTLTLEPLLPRYVSTVDNGNLVACLIALKAGCAGAAPQTTVALGTLAGIDRHAGDSGRDIGKAG